MTRIKGLGVEIKQRSTDIFQNKREGLECDTYREGKRGGAEIGVMIILTCSNMCQRETGRMKCHREIWGGGSSTQSSHGSEGRLQFNLPGERQEDAVWKKVERRRGRRESFPLPHHLQVRAALIKYPQARE